MKKSLIIIVLTLLQCACATLEKMGSNRRKKGSNRVSKKGVEPNFIEEGQI
jgi:hypothetical protein